MSRLWRRGIDAQLQPLGLTEATWMALLHISRAKEAMRQKDLASSLGLDNSSVVRVLSILETGGYIERQEGETDRRAKTLMLTSVGKSAVTKVERVSADAHRLWMGKISDAELEVAYNVVAAISQAISQVIPEGTSDGVSGSGEEKA